MARTVNPEQHAARRLHIIDAAMTCFAADGFERTTAAAICRRAGIGSGTFYHYFPTKVDVLLAILDLGTRETRRWFAALPEQIGGRQAIRAWVHETADQLSDPRAPTFITAVAAVMNEPRVAAALDAEEQAQREGLTPLVTRAIKRGEVRTDLTPDDLVAWLVLLVDGFTGRLTSESSFTVKTQRENLLDAVDRLLAPG